MNPKLVFPAFLDESPASSDTPFLVAEKAKHHGPIEVGVPDEPDHLQ
jgi:hypothetical protein